MSLSQALPWVLLTLAGLGLSALFSGIETGLYTLSRLRLAVRAGRGDPAALRLRKELRHPERLLSTLLIGNNLANYAGSLGLAAILDLAGFTTGAAVAINAALLVSLLFIFGETLPKDLFRTFTDRWTYRWSRYLVSWRIILTVVGLVPLVHAFGLLASRLAGLRPGADISARLRIAQLIKEGTNAGVISEAQAGLVERGLALRDRTVGEVMLPWRGVVSVRENAPFRQLEAIARQRSASRLPVTDESGRVVGVIRLIDALLEPRKRPRELMRPPVVLKRATPVLEALRQLRMTKTHLGVVADAGTGRPLGVVTINDLAGPLAGTVEQAASGASTAGGSSVPVPTASPAAASSGSAPPRS
ncbi:MAG: DUF21 domain-containing protein [Phycisphaerales bacterium]|nr:DUF21 domain-containing protein [Phycisphaerales bacterium]